MWFKRIRTSTVAAKPESLVNVLGVVYMHKKASDGGDLYLTGYGLQMEDVLDIENWYEKKWFRTHRQQLEGTSSVYRVPTKPVRGKSTELVVKNSRAGEDVPLETETLYKYLNADFNSPWEEFALVMEMRNGAFGPQHFSFKTQLPLAIYVPPEKMQLWQSGESRDRIRRLNNAHPGVELDILRQYKLVYKWIRGLNIFDVLKQMGLRGEELKSGLRPMTLSVLKDIEEKGYIVADMKPEHIIISEDSLRGMDWDGESERLKPGDIHALVEKKEYSVVDYELLKRTGPHENYVRDSRRHSYLLEQKNRRVPTAIPGHLSAVEIMGVSYIYGATESTDGRLWVVGKNAKLFDYFLPERWRNSDGWKLSENNEVFYSHTKDHVHIVWKASRVGESAAKHARKYKMAEYSRGFNSPFEEIAMADYLNKKGIKTVYFRAVYMTGSKNTKKPKDASRYKSHKNILCPDGVPVLSKKHDYILIRGFYNGDDEWVAARKGKLCRPVNLERALAENLVTGEEHDEILRHMQKRLLEIGVNGEQLKSNDLLLVMGPDEQIVLDDKGRPELRICNLEKVYFLK